MKRPSKLLENIVKLIDKKTSAAVVTVTAALIIAVSGIGKYHANPFTLTYKTEKPIALVMSPSGSPSVIVDRNGTVMLIMDGSGNLQRTVKVNNADHPNDIISSIHVKQDTIYADVVTVENQHFVREQIRIYDKKGKCLRTVKDDSYTDGNVFCPQNQVFIRDGSNLSIIRLENNILKTILLGKENTMVTDSVCFSEPVIEAMQGRDSALYVSSLFGKMFKYVPGSGRAEAINLSDDEYSDIFLTHYTSGTVSADYSPLYAIVNILFWLALSVIGATILFFAFRLFRHKYNRTTGIIIAAVLLTMGTIAFYTYHIFRQAKSQMAQMMVYQTDLMAYVTEHNYMGLVQSLSAGDTDSCLVQPAIMEQLTDLHSILAKSSQYDGNEYYVSIIYKSGNAIRQLVDNMNLESTGRPAYAPSLDWDAPPSDDTDITTDFNVRHHYSIRNVTDKTGKIVAKVVSSFPESLLHFKQKGKAFNPILILLSVLIGIYALFTFINALRHSVSEYIRRRRASLPYAKEQLFPTFYSLIVWFREVDRTLMVFIVPFFAAGDSIGDVASVTAMVLMAYSLGSIVMVPFTKLAYVRYGIRNVGIAAACVNLLSYVLMVVALKSTAVSLFYVAKFLSGASAGNVLTVVSHSLGASVKDPTDRATLFNEKQTVGNTINVLAILLGGIIVQYLNPVVLYAIAILLSALLIGISAITLSGLSKEAGQTEDKSPSWRDMVASFKFFLLRDGICVVCFVLLPIALLFGFLDFIFPLYASECGISPLMLSNIMVIGLALNLLLRKPLNTYYATIGTKRALMVQAATISLTLLILAVSPNIIWMTVICLIIYVLKMNSCVVLYQVEVIERNGFKQQDVQSDFLLADQMIRTVRMPFINMLVQAGRISASIWIGIICAILTGGLFLFDRGKKA